MCPALRILSARPYLHLPARLLCASGRFTYRSTGKVYIGEWVQGAPRCGEYKDASPTAMAAAAALMPLEHEHSATSGASNESFVLPQLKLDRAGAVLAAAVARARNERSGGRAFSLEELHTLQTAFDNIDSGGEGCVPIAALVPLLAETGVSVPVEAVDALLQELQAADAAVVAFPDFLDIVSLLQET